MTAYNLPEDFYYTDPMTGEKYEWECGTSVDENGEMSGECVNFLLNEDGTRADVQPGEEPEDPTQTVGWDMMDGGMRVEVETNEEDGTRKMRLWMANAVKIAATSAATLATVAS